MDLATGPTATAMDFTTARGRLRLSPRPLLIPTCCTVATGPTAMATPPTATAMEFTTARGRLRPRLTLTTTVDTTAMDSPTATAMDFTTARGRLRLSPRPLLIPTCCTWLQDLRLRPWTLLRQEGG